MKKTDETSCLINFLFQDITHSEQYLKESINLMWARKKANLPSVKWHKKVLGKQNYCWTGFIKHWVWETDTWRLYVSKKGTSLEVLVGLTPDQAWEAWQDYYQRMIK